MTSTQSSLRTTESNPTNIENRNNDARPWAWYAGRKEIENEVQC